MQRGRDNAGMCENGRARHLGAVGMAEMISDQQTPQEWLWFLDQVGLIGSYLEIGSYNGNSLLAIASSGQVKPGAIIRAVDLGNHGTGQQLQDVCSRLTAAGLDAQCLLANSANPTTEKWARTWAPYDVVFIDGDHSFTGVEGDWLQYGELGKIVAFHDIGGHEAGVVRFWQELKSRNQYKTLEYTAHARYQIVSLGQQGIGIVQQRSEVKP